jgi:hypothetical protein
MRLAAEYLSNFEVVKLTGVGHRLDDERVATAINRFLATLLSGA